MITYLPRCASRTAFTGLREYFSCLLPSGRPRWLIKTTDLAPFSRQCLMVGMAASILKTSKQTSIAPIIWPGIQHQVQDGMFVQWIFKPVCTPIQSDLKKCWTWRNVGPEEMLDPWLSIERPLKNSTVQMHDLFICQLHISISARKQWDFALFYMKTFVVAPIGSISRLFQWAPRI